MLNTVKIVIKENSSVIIIFLFTLLSLIVFFEYNREYKINTHLEQTQDRLNSHYKNIYQNFNNLAQNTFYGIINKPDIYDNIKNSYNKDLKIQNDYRERLYNRFIQDYSRLKSFNFEQFHFHTRDNKSFLRMHKPNKFGDDLSQVRYSVVTVNKTLKPINGFEVGRIIHGFRFVFPLFDENLEHIGSVETSVSSRFFENSFQENYHVDAHFLIKKDIFQKKLFQNELKKQIISVENEEYFISNESSNESFHLTHKNFYTSEELENIKDKMSKSDKFIMNKEENGNNIIICFIPIKNVEGITNAAYLVLYQYSEYIGQVNTSFYRLLFILFLSVFIFIGYLRYQHKKYEEDKQKNYILTQQSKMASMGEMIGNIAHQWRQPLSVISTAASGMKVQKEFGFLTDEIFLNSVQSIVDSTDYLSQTIDDFRNYFNNNKEKKDFKIQDIVDQTLTLFGGSLQQQNIIVNQNIDDIEIVSYPNELKQVFMNLVKNSKDAIGKDGLILIKAYTHDSEIKIEFLDTAGGIKDDIMDKIFEPYFTTKHQSVGTGLGLYMSYEIVTKSLLGTLDVKNKEFTYNFKNYKGALFTIGLNKKKVQFDT